TARGWCASPRARTRSSRWTRACGWRSTRARWRSLATDVAGNRSRTRIAKCRHTQQIGLNWAQGRPPAALDSSAAERGSHRREYAWGRDDHSLQSAHSLGRIDVLSPAQHCLLSDTKLTDFACPAAERTRRARIDLRA